MRRFLRCLLTLASATSGVLLVGVCGLWVRSHWTADNFGWDYMGGHRQLTSSGGWLLAFDLPAATPGLYSTGYVTFDAGAGDVGGDRVFPGVIRSDGDTVRCIGIAHWLVAVPLAAGTAPLLPHSRRTWAARRARTAGLCPVCRYDLRATPGRCPECGTQMKPTR